MTRTHQIGIPPFPIPDDFRTSALFLGSLADQSAEAAKSNSSKETRDEQSRRTAAR